MEKECRICKIYKYKEEFHKDRNSPDGICYYCKNCANSKARLWHKENKHLVKDARRNSWIKTRHGISLQEYTERLATQNYECAICGVKLSTSGYFTHLDHDHKTGRLRGFLCTNCNRGLGHFKDSVIFLTKACEYLNSHNANVDGKKEE